MGAVCETAAYRSENFLQKTASGKPVVNQPKRFAQSALFDG
jgi:hypothetical protein